MRWTTIFEILAQAPDETLGTNGLKPVDSEKLKSTDSNIRITQNKTILVSSIRTATFPQLTEKPYILTCYEA